LYTITDLERLVENREREIALRVDLLTNNPASPYVLQWIDDMSKLMCDLSDVCEFCRNAHSDPKWARAAQEAWIHGQGLMARYSNDVAVMKSLVSVTEDAALWNALSLEGRSMALDLIGRMAKAEHHPAVDAYLMESSQDLLRLETDIAASEVAGQFIDVGPAPVPSTFKPYSASGAVRVERGRILAYNDAGLMRELLALAPDASLRASLHAAAYTALAHRGPLFSELFRKRYVNAALSGDGSFAANSAKSLLLRDPAFTISRIQGFLDSISGAWEQELAVMRDLNAKVPSARACAKNLGFLKTPEPPALRASDLSYLRRVASSAVGPRSFGASRAEDEKLSAAHIYEYFPVWAVIEGADVLLRQLLGVHLRAAPLSLAEDWTIDEDTKARIVAQVGAADPSKVTSPSPTLLKLELVDTERDKPLGTVILDLFDRPGKNIADAQFVVQCGRVQHNDAFAPPRTIDEATAAGAPVDLAMCVIVLQAPALRGAEPCDPSALGQRPHADEAGDGLDRMVSRTLKHMPPHNHRALSPVFAPHAHRGGDRPLCLRPSSVRTLLHELGHATQTILAQTQFQHLSGSRCAMDFVETPSTLLERFASDPVFLRQMTRHYRTLEPLPEAGVSMILAQASTFAAEQVRHTAIRSLIDQRLHGVPMAYDEHDKFPFLQPTPEGGLQLRPEHTNAVLGTPLPPSATAADVTNTIIRELKKPRSILHADDAFPLDEATVDRVVRQFMDADGMGEGSNRPHLDNTHLVHYGGVYYTYIVCAAYSTLLYRLLRNADGTINAAEGRRYRDIVLKAGGSRNGLDLLADMLRLPGSERDYTVPEGIDIVKSADGSFEEDLKNLPMRAGMALERTQWNSSVLTDRHKKVIDLALEAYVAQINEESAYSVSVMRKSLNI
jgi:intermediate peptidase